MVKVHRTTIAFKMLGNEKAIHMNTTTNSLLKSGKMFQIILKKRSVYKNIEKFDWYFKIENQYKYSKENVYLQLFPYLKGVLYVNQVK